MEDEEEIDIVGNFDGFMPKTDTDMTNISTGQLLSCDYTVHPKWLNENADGGNYWSDSVPKNENLEENVVVLQSEEVIIEEPEPVTINDLEWAGENEIALQHNLVFEEDIPATIEEVVADQESEVSNSTQYQIANGNQQFFDGSEPAAFETHPPVKNIEYIGPTSSRSLLKVSLTNSPNPRSLLKNSVGQVHERQEPKFKQTLTVRHSLIKSNHMKLTGLENIKVRHEKNTEKQTSKKPASKFKQTLSLSQKVIKNEKFLILRKKLRGTRTFGGKRGPGGKGKRVKKQPTNFFGENITISHEVERKSASQPLLGSVIKLNDANSESDVEIDIESVDTIATTTEPPVKGAIEPKVDMKKLKKVFTSQNTEANESSEGTDKSYFYEAFKNLSEDVVAQLKTTEIPTEELYIEPNHISDIEKIMLAEFFEKRTTKTPEQYLWIRNHILTMWRTNKPNYVSKTSVRSGLKHGGDVNCISRIHRLLEQLGAINFGCDGKYSFVRPLENYLSMFMLVPRSRTIFSSNTSLLSLQIERRQRIRNTTNPVQITKENLDHDSNYTIAHMDGVIRPEPPMLNNRKSEINFRTSKTELDLVKCLKFSKENIAPFKVSITLSTLLCLQLHSLSSNYEVMGFLGGHRSKSVGRNKLSLTRYKPCRTSQQSRTTCEMCPVSQVEQSSSLGAEGHELLGWFHSHPLFPANPSRTDVATQKEMQIQFSFDNDRPFIGLILSCLNMSFKCMYVLPECLCYDFNASVLPYEVDVDIIKDCTNLKNDINDVVDIIKENCDSTSNLFEKFKEASDSILKQFGYKSDNFFVDIF